MHGDDGPQPGLGVRAEHHLLASMGDLALENAHGAIVGAADNGANRTS